MSGCKLHITVDKDITRWYIDTYVCASDGICDKNLIAQIKNDRKYIKLATLTPPYKVTFVLLISFLKCRFVTTIIRLPYHVHMVEWDNAQHIYCSPHPVQFLWDTDSLVHTLVHKELDIGSCMLPDTLFHIPCTLDPQWDNLFLLIYQCSYGNNLYCLTIWWHFCS